MSRRGAFLELMDEDRQIRRVVRETGERIPIRRLFVKLSDVVPRLARTAACAVAEVQRT